MINTLSEFSIGNLSSIRGGKDRTTAIAEVEGNISCEDSHEDDNNNGKIDNGEKVCIIECGPIK